MNIPYLPTSEDESFLNTWEVVEGISNIETRGEPNLCCPPPENCLTTLVHDPSVETHAMYAQGFTPISDYDAWVERISDLEESFDDQSEEDDDFEETDCDNAWAEQEAMEQSQLLAESLEEESNSRWDLLFIEHDFSGELSSGSFQENGYDPEEEN